MIPDAFEPLNNTDNAFSRLDNDLFAGWEKVWDRAFTWGLEHLVFTIIVALFIGFIAVVYALDYDAKHTNAKDALKEEE